MRVPHFCTAHKVYEEKQKERYDLQHRVWELPVISDGREVWVTTRSSTERERVLSQSRTPRSYIVETSSGTVHRNQFHLGVVPQKEYSDKSEQEEPSVRNIMTRTQTGTVIKPPCEYRDQMP